MPQSDPVWIVYQGPPLWDGQKWINGDKFFISGHKRYQRNLGIELANGVDGLEAPVREYRYDTDASNPGATYVSSVAVRRTLSGQINVHGKDAKDMRRNKARWYRNHPEGNPGRLWFFTSNGEPRYLPAIISEEAANGTLEKDPNLWGVTRELEWGWQSDSAYFLGYRETKTFKPVGGGRYTTVFYNPSTAPRVYPELFLPGPGRWEVSLGYRQPNFTTPQLEKGDVAKLDYDPRHPTFMKKSAAGVITNLWPSMVGSRPKFCLEPMTKNELSVRYVGQGTPDGAPQLKFAPEFTSWT